MTPVRKVQASLSQKSYTRLCHERVLLASQGIYISESAAVNRLLEKLVDIEEDEGFKADNQRQANKEGGE